MHLFFPMVRTYTSPSQRPSKHRNAKRTKGRKRTAILRGQANAARNRERRRVDGPYRD